MPIHLDSEDSKKLKANSNVEAKVTDPVPDVHSSKPAHVSARMQNTNTKSLPYSEVQRHTTTDSCWIIVDGQVYDVTSILDTHPGGRSVLLKNAGKDATYALRDFIVVA